MRAFLLLSAALLGCGPADLAVRLEKPWGEGAVGVALALVSGGQALAPTPAVVLPGERLELRFEDEAFDLVLDAYPAELGAGLRDCGLRLGGFRPALPPSAGTWRAHYDPEAGLSTLAAGPTQGLDVRYDRCDPPTPCSALQLELRAPPWPGYRVAHLAWIPGNRWVLVGEPTLGSAGILTKVALLSEAGEITELGDGLSTRVLGLAWDQAYAVYLSLADGRLLAINTEGVPALVERPSPGFFGGRLAVRPDGLLILHPVGGPAQILNLPTDVTLTAADFPPAIDRLQMAGPDQMAALDGPRLLVYDPSGPGWVERQQLPAVDPDTSLVWAGSALLVFSRTFAYQLSGEDWSALPAPTGVTLPSTSTGLFNGALVLGGVGGAAYWKFGAWCPLTTPSVFSAFRSASTSANGLWAAGGSDPDSSVGLPKVLIWH